ncbi:DnaJ domain-containing protein [Hygrophoropsis aurantiaca]|uniref:DnaJ domain-containing protein n=1 Tax=Hygrophoropsis aurantiaca TaxID=72124 RepID=A0ACB8ALQ1_9AGAM|nr:DnaJ domain-containing protein [Hygrophoropsis aurantiaca]
MRLFVFIASLAVLVTVVSAWTKEDHEIFDLVGALEGAEGKGTTFYSWLDIPSSASLSQINKAYRKKSIQLHPDKNPGVKGIHDRFARLGVIATILRDTEGRKRYDFFYKNGVPKWRGTGYYYARFRPGLGTVFVFLTFLTSGLQYLVQRLNYTRDLAKIEQTIRDARLAAWGQKMEPLQGKRKVKVNLGGGARVDDEGNYVNGRTIDMVVDGDQVYIFDPSGDHHLLDTGSAVRPAISRTWFIVLVSSLFQKITGRKDEDIDKEDDKDAIETDDASDSPASGSVTPSGASEAESKHDLKAGRAAVAMAGGRRRKAVRKR